MLTEDPATEKLGRILVVDDEVELMTILTHSLTAQKYHAAGFTSAREALEALRKEDFDVLLTDMMMPEMNGIELLRAALEIDPHLVCIVMTGQGTVQTAVEAMKEGAHDYVLKPFKLNMLLPAMKRYMETRRLRLENFQLRETMALYELSQTIAFSLNRTTILNKLADGALRQCEADEVSVMLPTPNGREFYIAVALGENRDHLQGLHVPITEGIAGWVAAHHEPLFLRGEVADERFAPLYPRAEIGSAISMPMMVDSKLVGVLNVNTTRRSRPFIPGQIKTLSILTGTAATALEGARLHEELKAAEEKYRGIFENAIDGIFQSAADGRLLTANSAMVQMLGCGGLNASGQLTTSLKQLFVDPGVWDKFQRRMVEDGAVLAFEARAHSEEGIAWISLNARTVRDSSGETLFYEGIIEDITARKLAEERQSLRHAVTESLAQAKTVSEGAAAVLEILGERVGWDLGALWIMEPNAEVLQCLAIWKNGAGDNLADIENITRNEIQTPTGTLLEPIWEHGEPIFYADLLQEKGLEFLRAPLVEEAGLHSWFGIPIHLGNKVYGAIEFFSHKIREPEPQFLELMASLGSQIGQFIERNYAEEELNHFFTLSLDMLCVAGFDGYYKRLNPAWESTLGYNMEELMSEPYINFVHPDDLEATLRAADQSSHTTLNFFENRYRCKDGSYKWLLWASTPVAEHRLIYAAARDITERKEAEWALARSHQELEQRVTERTSELAKATEEMQQAKDAADAANMAKSEFLSRMSHELRTPLNAVLGFGQMLEMDTLSSQQQSNVAHIIKGGRHLLNLINEVLDLARIESGRMDLSVEPVALRETLMESLSLVRPLAAQRDVDLNLECDSSGDILSGYIWADQQRLKQVLLNLLNNAIKYNRESGRVWVTCEEVAASGANPAAPITIVDQARARIRIAIHDSGPGIPQDKMERLFTPFDRLGAEHTRIEGTGLGLALSRRMIEAMGGVMGVESVEGEGSIFWLELFRAEQLRRVEQIAEQAKLFKVANYDGTVLYIEDNLSNFELVEQLLRQRPGIELLTAMQGSVGLELARQHRPDLILLDLHLPDLHGHEVLVRLRASAETCNIPVIVLSADATPGQIQRLKSAGALDYLTKPLDVLQFMKVLDEALLHSKEAIQPDH